MTLDDGPDESHCGMGIESGPANALGDAVGRDPVKVRYESVEGAPVAFDASRSVVARIYVMSTGPSAGPTELVARLTGLSAEDETVIAEGSKPYSVSPTEDLYEVVVELQTVKQFDKLTFERLRLYLHNRGPAPLHGVYRLDDPASSFTMGVWQP